MYRVTEVLKKDFDECDRLLAQFAKRKDLKKFLAKSKKKDESPPPLPKILVSRRTEKQKVMADLEVLKRSRFKFDEVLRKIQKYEKKHKIIKQSLIKSRKFNLDLVKRNISEQKNYSLKKKYVRIKELRTSYTQTLGKVKEFRKLRDFKLRKEVKNLGCSISRKLCYSEDKRNKMIHFRKTQKRRMKWIFLVHFLSRVKFLGDELRNDRERRRRNEVEKNTFFVFGILRKTVKLKRMKKTLRVFRIFRFFWRFSIIWIRIIRRKKSTKTISRFLYDIHKAHRFHVIYLKFIHKVKFAQYCFRRYIAFKSSRLMFGVLQFTVCMESLFAEKSTELKMLIPFSSQSRLTRPRSFSREKQNSDFTRNKRNRRATEMPFVLPIFTPSKSKSRISPGKLVPIISPSTPLKTPPKNHSGLISNPLKYCLEKNSPAIQNSCLLSPPKVRSRMLSTPVKPKVISLSRKSPTRSNSQFSLHEAVSKLGMRMSPNSLKFARRIGSSYNLRSIIQGMGERGKKKLIGNDFGNYIRKTKLQAFCFVRPTYIVIRKAIKKEQKKILRTYQNQVLEFLEFSFVTDEDNQGNNSGDRLEEVHEEPVKPVIMIPRDRMKSIVFNCLKRVKYYSQKKNRNLRGNSRMAVNFTDIERKYFKGVEKSKVAIVKFFGKKVLERYKGLFEEADETVQKIRDCGRKGTLLN